MEEVKAQNKPKKNRNIIIILVSLTVVVIIGIIAILFLNQPDTNEQKIDTQPDNPISTCTTKGSVIFNEGKYQTCDGVEFTEVNVDEAIKVIENQNAKNGIVDFYFPYIESNSKLVTGNQLQSNFLPNGVSMYLPANQEPATYMIVNNLFLNRSNSIDNEFLVNEVREFLDLNPKYTGDEPLGQESQVLAAFDVFLTRVQSVTIDEPDLSNNSLEYFDKQRTFVTLDGDYQNGLEVSIKTFASKRDNVILIQTLMEKETQERLKEKHLRSCEESETENRIIKICYARNLSQDKELNELYQNRLDKTLQLYFKNE